MSRNPSNVIRDQNSITPEVKGQKKDLRKVKDLHMISTKTKDVSLQLRDIHSTMREMYCKVKGVSSIRPAAEVVNCVTS